MMGRGNDKCSCLIFAVCGGARKEFTVLLLVVVLSLPVILFTVFTGIAMSTSPSARRTTRPSASELAQQPKHLQVFSIDDGTESSNAFAKAGRNCPKIDERISKQEYCSLLHARDPGIQAPRVHLPLQRGTFLYLVQAEYTPNQFWVNVSRRTDSSVLWMSWKIRVPDAVQVRTFAEYIFLPKSSFNTGRNHLLNKGLQLESTQGWSFEFFIFADEDQDQLTVAPYGSSQQIARRIEERIMRTMENATRVNMRPKSVFLLHYLLLNYRPARAGILHRSMFGPAPPYVGCVSTAYMDLALEVFHRTALLAMMPYNSKFDDVNWWFSTPVMNLFARLLLGPYTVQFRQLVNYPDGSGNTKQKHTGYPRQYPYEDKVFCYLVKCLNPGAERVARIFSDARLGMQAIKISADTKQEADPPPCLRMPRTVDYSSIINSDIVEQNWFRPVRQ